MDNLRNMCSDLPHNHLPKLVSWLMLAFVLCRDVPVLFQKVSRLLAAVFVLSASSDLFSLSSSSKTLCVNHWPLIFIKLHLALILVANFSRIYLRYLMFNTL